LADRSAFPAELLGKARIPHPVNCNQAHWHWFRLLKISMCYRFK
jgi:hypothetical protein